jgi:hypothetical protein
VSVHRAEPGDSEHRCRFCGQPIKQVPGGRGPTWIHADSGAVAGYDPPDIPSDSVGYKLEIEFEFVGRGPTQPNYAAPEIADMSEAAVEAAKQVIKSAGYIVARTGYGHLRQRHPLA